MSTGPEQNRCRSKAGHKVETAKPEDGGSGLIYRIALSASADVGANNNAEATQ